MKVNRSLQSQEVLKMFDSIVDVSHSSAAYSQTADFEMMPAQIVDFAV